mmetsp:Transcript_8347/g.21236  ORF Transcript_8347/g.21236 Transcript_8347/m.21236 type:complete len:221 (+) Transcript_8347:205-867(+)
MPWNVSIVNVPVVHSPHRRSISGLHSFSFAKWYVMMGKLNGSTFPCVYAYSSKSLKSARNSGNQIFDQSGSSRITLAGPWKCASSHLRASTVIAVSSSCRFTRHGRSASGMCGAGKALKNAITGICRPMDRISIRSSNETNVPTECAQKANGTPSTSFGKSTRTSSAANAFADSSGWRSRSLSRPGYEGATTSTSPRSFIHLTRGLEAGSVQADSVLPAL